MKLYSKYRRKKYMEEKMPSATSAGKSPHSGITRASGSIPVSERQQMALVMQMTSDGSSSETKNENQMSSRARNRNERGETPLHIAAIRGDEEQVQILLEQGADPNSKDFAGWTPLHEACNHGWLGIAKRLLHSGADVNARGLDDDTPLHDAAVNGHAKLVSLLVDYGADINQKNRRGKTPQDVAGVDLTKYLYSWNSSIIPQVTVGKRPAKSLPTCAPQPKRFLVNSNDGDRTKRLEISVNNLPGPSSVDDVEDEYDKFASHIAAQLRALPVRSFVILQEKIQALVTAERLSCLQDASANDGSSSDPRPSFKLRD